MCTRPRCLPEVVAVLVLALAAANCRPYVTPPPGFTLGTLGIVGVSHADIIAYAARLRYDTTPPEADVKAVDFVNQRIDTGDTALLAPEIGTHNLTEAELAEGRVVGFVRSRVAHPGAHVGPWRTYLWIDKKGGTTRDAWRSVLIAENDTTKDTLPLERHPANAHPYTPPCPQNGICARFRVGTLLQCYSCPGGWCSSPIPKALQ
jgi:hypothetical protein